MRKPDKRERKRVLVAVLASLLLHLVIALSLAAFNGSSASLPPLDDQPVQLTVMDLSPPPPPKPVNPPYMETDPARETAEQPKEKTFESNANSIAKSQAPSSGDAAMPSQQGREQPFMDLQTQQYSVASQGMKAPPQPETAPSQQPTVAPTPVPTPKARPSEAPKPSATPTSTPEPLATPEPDKLAMLTGTPPPALRDAEEHEATPPPELTPTPPPVTERPRPQRPATAYQAQKEQTRITGRISDRGPAAVNAVATPLGRYQKQVSDAIGGRWYYYMKAKMDMVNIGTAHVEAEVDEKGKIRNLRILSNNSNEAFANICLQSFQEAQIPPIPADLIATLPEGRLPVDIFFTTYANQ